MFSIPCTFVSMRINKGVQHEFDNHVCSRVSLAHTYFILHVLCIINKGNTSKSKELQNQHIYQNFILRHFLEPGWHYNFL